MLRLTTDAPLSYITQETPFALTHPMTLVLGPDEPLEASIDALSREFLERTRSYWSTWVRGLGVSLDWQDEIIRAAITLKLCQFEETGAIIAAHTTSIPEAPGTSRNWDYRYCWLRDSYFVLRALNRLGATQTMEAYLGYITTIAVDVERPLRPVYGIIHDQSLEERVAADLAGYRGMGPVRIGNQAAEQMQHDAYGSVILGASHMFIDRRLPGMGDEALFRRLEPLGHQARKFFQEPDAGPWEYRGRQRIHTHSATMCWVACDRLARMADLIGLGIAPRTGTITRPSSRPNSRARMEREARSDRRRARPRRPRCQRAAARRPRPAARERRALPQDLRRDRPGAGRNGFIMRYTAEDDFGLPETAFLVCKLWYADALAATGETDKAREIFTDVLARRNSYVSLARISTPRRVSCGAIFPRLTVWPGSSARA